MKKGNSKKTLKVLYALKAISKKKGQKSRYRKLDRKIKELERAV